MNKSWGNFFSSFIHSKLEGRFIIQKALVNTSWLVVDQILRMSVGLFVGVWVARYLGPEQFGLYSYAIAFVTLFSPLAALGLDNIAVRNIVKVPDSANEILGTAFILKLVGGILALALAIASIIFIRPKDYLTHWLVVIIAVSFIFWAFSAIDFWFKSQVQSKYTVYATSSAFLLANIGKVVLILIKAPLVAFACAYSAEIILAAVSRVVVYHINKRKISEFVATFQQAKKLMKDCWPLVLSLLMITTYMRIDQIMLGNMVGKNSVGIYSAAVRLSEMWYFIPTAITVSIFPSIIESKKINERLYLNRLQMLYNLMTWIAIPIAVFATLLRNSIIELLYGHSFNEAGIILAIHIWAGIFVFLGVASNQFLLTENYTRIAFLRTFIGATANIGLNLLLIPKFQVIGAAITTLTSQFLAVFCIVFIKKTRQQATMMIKSLYSMPTFKKPL